MMRFKQYLNEVARDWKRSMNFAKKWGDRHPLHPDPDMRSNEVYPKSMRTPLKDWDQAPGADEDAFHDKWLGGADTETSKPMKIPVKHLYSTQGEVDRHFTIGGLALKKNPDEEKPIQVVYHRDKEGNHGFIVRDGHHRASEARFRGDTHINAVVHHSKDMPPPKDLK